MVGPASWAIASAAERRAQLAAAARRGGAHRAEHRADRRAGQSRLRAEAWGSVRVGIVGDEAAGAWDEFVHGHPDGSFFRLHGWTRAIESGLGHRALPLAAMAGGRIAGILPLSLRRSPLFGDALVSAGCATGGGVVAESIDAAAALEAEAMRLARELRVGHVDLRDLSPPPAPSPEWRVVVDVHAMFDGPIAGDEEAILRAIPRKGRRHDVWRSLGRGLGFVAGAPVQDFHRVLCESYRNLGTPVFPLRHMQGP